MIIVPITRMNYITYKNIPWRSSAMASSFIFITYSSQQILSYINVVIYILICDGVCFSTFILCMYQKLNMYQIQH